MNKNLPLQGAAVPSSDQASEHTRITRRQIIVGTAAALGGTHLTFPAHASPASHNAVAGSSMRRQSSPESASPVPGTDIVEERSIDEIAAGYDAGDYTVADVVQASLDRIDALDQQGPTLNAMLEINPQAMDIAAELDRELQQGTSRGPMHGIPVVLKDVFATTDGMLNTSGSLAMMENLPVAEAFLVERLREAGAVILGKTNLTEWSNYRGTLSGWSSRGGITVNPYATNYTAWGSSTGSAVAAAASYATIGIGSETDGSIICPSGATSLVGLKPTVGLVSRSGGIPISFSQDSPGPMGRSVKDVAIAMGAISGYDPTDVAFGMMAQYSPATSFQDFPVPDPGQRDYVKTLSLDGLEGIRVGVCRFLFGFDPDVDGHIENAILAMREAGAEIIEDVQIPSYFEISDGVSEGIILTREFAWGFQNYIDTITPDGPVTELADIVDYYNEHPDETRMEGDTDALSFSVWAGGIDDPYYLDLLEETLRQARELGIDQAMDTNEVDVLIAPSVGLPTPIDGGIFYGSTSQLPSIAGYPSISLPVGFTNGLPAGMHMFGRAFSERKMLRYAYALENILNVRQAPKYLAEPEWT